MTTERFIFQFKFNSEGFAAKVVCISINLLVLLDFWLTIKEDKSLKLIVVIYKISVATFEYNEQILAIVQSVYDIVKTVSYNLLI